MDSYYDGADLPTAVGSVRGVRSFRVRETQPGNGAWKLGPVWRSADKPWTAGENKATHDSFYNPFMWLNPEVQQNHHVAQKGCSCGFYAHTDGKDDYGSQLNTVTGIIEGYGRVTLGTRGFRAEKARIVALVDDKPDQPTYLPEPVQPELDRWDLLALRLMARHKSWWVTATLTAVGVGPLVMAAVSPWFLFAWLLLVPAGLLARWVVGRTTRVAARDLAFQVLKAEVTHKNLRLSKDGRFNRAPGLDAVFDGGEYEGIPVFKSLDEAVAAFPLGYVKPEVEL